MSVKRRNEFFAGRLCAAQALREMHIPTDFPLPAHGRLPVWPAGVLGSISHCTQLAAAVTTTKPKYPALGIDVECQIPAATAHEIQLGICHHKELVHLDAHLPDREKSLTILFSAKEALYKALFPSVGRFMGFDAAEFYGCEDGAVVLQLTRDWTSCWRIGMRVAVRYAWVDSIVVSVVCIPNGPNAS